MIVKILPEIQKLYIQECTLEEHKSLKNYINFHAKNYRFDKRFKLGIWDGKVHFYGDDRFVPIGLWREVYKCCQECGYQLNILNPQDFPLNRNITSGDMAAFADTFFKYHRTKDNSGPFTPRGYQTEAAFNILKNRYCNTEIATSGGKSVTFAMVVFYMLRYVDPDARFLLVVPTSTLVRQFYDDIIDYNYGFHNENPDPLNIRLEEIMSDKPRRLAPGEPLPHVYIGTYQSLCKYPSEWFAQFTGVCFDEAHGAKSSSVQKIGNNCIPHTYIRCGMSGTFPEEDSAELMAIYSITGPIITKIKAKKLMDSGAITQVKIKRVLIDHNDRDFHERVNTIRKGDGKKAFDIEVAYIQDSMLRLNLVYKICDAAKTNTLVLFKNIEYGKRIFDKLSELGLDNKKRVYYIDGNTKEDERGAIKQQMELTDVPAILVASYGTLSTGVSINAIQNVVLADSYKSYQKVIQAIGRALRLHKLKAMAYIFDLCDRFTFDKNIKDNALFVHAKERKKMYDREEYPYEDVLVRLKND